MRISIVVLAACGGATATTPANQVAPELPSAAPDLARLRDLLAPHTKLAFDPAARGRGCPSDQDVGRYVAMLVENGSTGDQHALTGGCGPFPAKPTAIDPPPDPRYWFCTIDAYTRGAEGDAWHYELRLRVRKADGAPDLASLACPGSS